MLEMICVHVIIKSRKASDEQPCLNNTFFLKKKSSLVLKFLILMESWFTTKMKASYLINTPSILSAYLSSYRLWWFTYHILLNVICVENYFHWRVHFIIMLPLSYCLIHFASFYNLKHCHAIISWPLLIVYFFVNIKGNMKLVWICWSDSLKCS